MIINNRAENVTLLTEHVILSKDNLKSDEMKWSVRGGSDLLSPHPVGHQTKFRSEEAPAGKRCLQPKPLLLLSWTPAHPELRTPPQG